MNVSAVIPTRGNVDLQPVIDSLPSAWEIVIWDNGERMVTRSDGFAEVCTDLAVYGRYAAIECATHDLIFTQDDDVIIGDPQAIVRAWGDLTDCNGPRDCVGTERGCEHCHPGIQGTHLVANMPLQFRHDGYTDSCLVGFGACFHRDLPAKMFNQWLGGRDSAATSAYERQAIYDDGLFRRACDVVFTTLAPARVLVDVPKVNREFAEDTDRMFRQPNHVGERQRMLELARKVRDQ